MSFKRSRTDFEADKSASLQQQQQQPPYVFYGTPLPPLDSEARDDGSYVPIWKQEVRDERGRKRLHGAFTGGFSAGYFNTVGSKEGWTPSTFVSSRTNRHKDAVKPAEQRAEDFMDEEDLADLQESQKLETQGGYAGLGSTEQDGQRRGLISDLLRDPNDTMGVKLLQRMGWRPGQGLGPKVRRKARGDQGMVEDNEQEQLFAPDDVPMITFEKKTNKFGLGWHGEQRLGSSTSAKFGRSNITAGSDSEDEQDSFRARRTLQKKPKVKKTGFGVGVLNDTGSDEEDPYEIGPKISYNKIIGGDRKKKKGGLISSNTTGNVSKPVFLSQKLTTQSRTTNFRRCHDGRLPLDGFVLAAQALTLDDNAKYTPLPVPEGWTPRSLGNTTSRSTVSTAQSLDASSRATLLGESPLPGKSIFDFISPAARDRLAATTGAALPQGRGESAPAGFEPTASDRAKSMWDLVPRLDRATAQAALDKGKTGWMPYGEDEGKRSRYRAYLEIMVGERQGLPLRKEGVGTEEWSGEMGEFKQAAEVFKPVSGAMASRFMTARSVEGAKSGIDTVSREETSQKEKDPAEEAARLGMFGPLTRSVERFYPTRLVCKRFGVRAPEHVLHEAEVGEKAREREKLDVLGKTRMEEMMKEAATSTVNNPEGAGVTVPVREQPAAVDAEKNDALEAQRAGEELFKSIFGDDSDSD
ncbi:G patch domain-containing protein 1 isoform C [Sphaceloma murrayae]|uniref:G patch domain-containing protein 1 isoform C n=1 Tax=Sphaceloma murrayae TaxID=2082308 RepID=A0A2K1QY22_9PEZI|nr:G patch domain-containing protein 1 isoform C [Sphaceloma murrayae]